MFVKCVKDFPISFYDKINIKLYIGPSCPRSRPAPPFNLIWTPFNVASGVLEIIDRDYFIIEKSIIKIL